MIVVPAETPVNTPVELPIVATFVSLEDQTPVPDEFTAPESVTVMP